MEGLNFYARYGRLRDRSPEGRTWESGRCQSCGAAEQVTPIGHDLVCASCVPLRQTYWAPSATKKNVLIKQTMAKGRFALITTEAAIYWTSHRLTEFDVEVRPAKKQQRVALWSLIDDPPPLPYLFIIFAPANRGDRLVLNTNPDYVRFSGVPLSTAGPVPITGVNRAIVLDLLHRFPTMSGTDWDNAVRARADLHRPDLSGDARRKLDKLGAKHGFERATWLPPLWSPEHLFLRIKPDVRDSND